MAVSPEATRAAQALDELYRAHRSQVYRYAYGVLGNHADAEDVTQSTFVNALRAMERGERPRKPGNWLITIAHNVARERFRRAQARPLEVAFDADIAAARSTQDDEALPVADLLRALARIPQAQRSALVMREFEGRPYAEIARSLDITKGALETLLFRARRSVAEELENVVTCERAQQDLGRLADGTLGRKERRRLDDHLRECASCRRLQPLRPKPKRALARLALLLPFPLPGRLFAGKSILSGATSGSSDAGVGTGAGAVAGAGAGGTLAVGTGVAVKVAAVVISATAAGGIGYAGVDQIRSHRTPAEAPARNSHADTRDAGAGNRTAPTGAAIDRTALAGSASDRSKARSAGNRSAENGTGRSLGRAAARRASRVPATSARTPGVARKRAGGTSHVKPSPSPQTAVATAKKASAPVAKQPRPTSGQTALAPPVPAQSSHDQSVPDAGNGQQHSKS